MQSVIDEINTLDTRLARHGIRNAEKKLPSVKRLVDSALLLDTAKNCVAGQPALVRAIVFDKTPDKNWLVAWHQDRTVAVSNKMEMAGWSAWTVKDGVHHAQPSVDVLENMVTFRLHLDDANERNGCLKVIPNSHRMGVLSQSEIERIVHERETHTCVAKAGDLLVMRPLLLHASSKAAAPLHRRILHVEYSGFVLPQGVAWA